MFHCMSEHYSFQACMSDQSCMSVYVHPLDVCVPVTARRASWGTLY